MDYHTLWNDSLPWNLSSNETECKINEDFQRTFYAAAYSLIFVLGVVTNSIALAVFCCCLDRHTETTIYMCNLILSDLFFIATLPLRTTYYVRGTWDFGAVVCKLSGALFLVNMYGSIMFLTCIAADRFLAIVHPFRSRTLRTPCTARFVCFVVWCIVLLGASPSFFVKTSSSEKGNKTTCFENFSKDIWKGVLSSIVIFIEVVGFLIPFIIMVYCSCAILKTMSKPSRLQRCPFDRKRIHRMITVTLIIFVTCFLPHHILLVFYTLVRRDNIQGCRALQLVKMAYPITLCLASANCCLDPIIYYFTTDAFRRSLRRGVDRGSSFLLSETFRVAESIKGNSREHENGRASLSHTVMSDSDQLNRT
uniref:lysophosphatidic acid receptor 6-like n=1 Tax=Myxine glutinosa TaxID=7769 RepID=UPI00358EF0BB